MPTDNKKRMLHDSSICAAYNDLLYDAYVIALRYFGEEQYPKCRAACEVGAGMAEKMESDMYQKAFMDVLVGCKKMECETSNKRGAVFKTTDVSGELETDLQPTVKETITAQYVLPIMFPGMFKHRSQQKQETLLMYSPPGMGKTFSVANIAKFIYQETRKFCNLRIVNAADLKDPYVGMTEKNIQGLFTQAASDVAEKREVDYSVVFIDEVESLAMSRANAQKQQDNSVAMLLQMLDGAVARPGVLTIIATNLPWALDSAILSRCTSKIFLDVPNTNTRKTRIQKFLSSSVRDLTDAGSSNLVNWLTEITGMNTEAPSVLTKAIPLKAKSPTFDETLKKRGHETSAIALSTFGYSHRDMDKVLRFWMDAVADQKIHSNVQDWPPPKPEGAKTGCTIRSDAKCVPNPKAVEINQADLLKWGRVDPNKLPASELQPDDYVNHIRYSLNGEGPRDMENTSSPSSNSTSPSSNSTSPSS